MKPLDEYSECSTMPPVVDGVNERREGTAVVRGLMVLGLIYATAAALSTVVVLFLAFG